MNPKVKIFLSAIAPLVLLAALLAWFFAGGSKLLERPSPPIEELTIQRVEFLKDPRGQTNRILLHVRNTGPQPIDLKVATIDEMIWGKVAFNPAHLERLQSGTVEFAGFDWVEQDPYKFALFTAIGTPFETEVAAALETPQPSGKLFGIFALFGVYVGVLPVLLGILWLPFMRTLSAEWMNFFLAFTVGLLVFIGIEALHGAIEAMEKVPDTFHASGVLALGFLAAIFVIAALDRALRGNMDEKSDRGALVLAYLVALGIGIHNLGEGLAIGSAYAVGEIALGAMLLVGFTVHNTTEGLAIVAPLVRSVVSVKHLALLGVVGGAPAILGIWIGGFTVAPLASVLFLAVGAGAVFQVVYTIGAGIVRRAEGEWLRWPAMAGFFAGMVVMLITALLIPGQS